MKARAVVLAFACGFAIALAGAARPPQVEAQSGTDFSSYVQFDAKGVDFGPWLRRFVAQLKRNWLVPLAPMSQKGHVPVTFSIHKDGHVTDASIRNLCAVAAFNESALRAVISSDPTYPMPDEYPASKALFTVTFYYNERPGAHRWQAAWRGPVPMRILSRQPRRSSPGWLVR